MPRRKSSVVRSSKEENNISVISDPDFQKNFTQLVGLLLLKFACDYINNHRDIMNEVFNNVDSDIPDKNE